MKYNYETNHQELLNGYIQFLRDLDTGDVTVRIVRFDLGIAVEQTMKKESAIAHGRWLKSEMQGQ